MLTIVWLGILISACKSDPPVPKPRGYDKINLPQSDGQTNFEFKDCSFTFEYPNHLRVEQDTLYFNERPEDPCWLNLVYPEINGVVHMSYKPLAKNDFGALTEEYHKMTYKHVVKADYIDNIDLKSEERNFYGLMNRVGGNVASAYQFYLTDSSEHFVRGALYFNASPNADSLGPAVTFVKDDLLEIFDTWEWK